MVCRPKCNIGDFFLSLGFTAPTEDCRQWAGSIHNQEQKEGRFSMEETDYGGDLRQLRFPGQGQLTVREGKQAGLLGQRWSRSKGRQVFQVDCGQSRSDQERSRTSTWSQSKSERLRVRQRQRQAGNECVSENHYWGNWCRWEWLSWWGGVAGLWWTLPLQVHIMRERAEQERGRADYDRSWFHHVLKLRLCQRFEVSQYEPHFRYTPHKVQLQANYAESCQCSKMLSLVQDAFRKLNRHDK